MAEPARRPNADIDPDIRPDLRAIPGGGQTTSDRGDLSLVKDLEENPDTLPNQATLEDESNPKSNVIQGPWDNKTGTTGPKGIDVPKLQKVVAFAKKRGGIIGLIALFGVGGGVLASLFAPAGMLIGLMENFSLSNDSSSTVLERRFMKAFGFATQENVLCSGNKLKCTMGQISNRGLYQLSKKGVVALTDGVEYDGKKTGYPTKNPTHYRIDLDDGYGPRTIAAKDLTGFLTANPKAAAMLLGTSGAYNLRFKAWTGKHITKKVYKKFGLAKSGGTADGTNQRTTLAERKEAALAKLREKIPGAEAISSVADGIKGKVEGQLGKAKKGGVAYVGAVAGCIGVKAPAYFAGGVAAIQATQVISTFWNAVQAPGGMAKAATIGSGFTAEDMEVSGTILTERTPRASDGKLTSALDSQHLQAAAGINTGRPAVSAKLTPGYSFLTNPAIVIANDADRKLEPACNTIMSPAAMYTALAVDSAVTVAASATVIGGIVKVIAGIAISEVVTRVAVEVAGEAARAALTEFATNKDIETAEGEALGDVIGMGASLFFASGGMARHLPVLTEGNQVSAYNEIRQENEDFRKEMDVASLSPFDTSSKYTFLGSMLQNARMAIISSGQYTGSLSSIFSSILTLPSLTLSPTTSADAYPSDDYCSYAEEFGLSTKSDNNPSGAGTPAITASGAPCTGMTLEQDSMTTNEAIDLVAGEGWLDESKEINEGDDIDAMVASGYIKADTPLYDFITTCGDLSTGDYIYNAGGCTVNTDTKDLDPQLDACADIDGEQVCASENDEWANYEVPEGVKNPDSLAAMSVVLVDFQLSQIIKGEDDLHVEEEAEEVGYVNDSDTQTAYQSTPVVIDYSQPLLHCLDYSINPFNTCSYESLYRQPKQRVGIA